MRDLTPDVQDGHLRFTNPGDFRTFWRLGGGAEEEALEKGFAWAAAAFRKVFVGAVWTVRAGASVGERH